ncbi:MAG: hypothetical protein CMK04_13520 [Ponticaulis sp.]|nr:hypothetical protein [Ponticaulis sp.]
MDLLAYTQVTDRIILEPASEEDLETEIADEPDALTQSIKIGTRRLVVQCKRKTTGPWTEGDLRRLLAHGEKRIKPKDRLKDPAINYLLVTSADLTGVARDLAVEGHNQWSRVTSIPTKIAALLPADAPGRLAVWNALNDELLDARLEKRLTERFRVPYSKVSECIATLGNDALDRMRGAGNGVWTRDEVIRTIRDHNGYDGISDDAKDFVPPTNWDAIKEKLNSRNAVVITGPSGTGKTTTAKALVAGLKEEIPGIRHERVRGGPEQIRDDQDIGPVVYEIEDPWGKYRLDPQSKPWNDSINEILASASSDKRFVITSRSDMMLEAGLKTLDDRFAIKLVDENYTKSDRIRLFENRLTSLPYVNQVTALKYQKDAIDSLLLPLEIERFFSGVASGPLDGENEATHLRRCLREASEGAIENSLLNGISQRESWAQTAVIWALMKARKRIPFGVISELEWELIDRDKTFEDKLEAFVDFLITGRNLKRDDSVLSCSHPRVEAGLEKATLEKPRQATRAINYLIESLIALDAATDDDWWLETAVLTCAATFPIEKLKIKISENAQAQIDHWLECRLATADSTFRDDLKLAIAAGSEKCAVAELARWLDSSPVDRQWFNLSSWKEPKRSPQWYEWISSAPYTHIICATYIERLIGFKNGSFHGNFHEVVAKLSPNLTPSFQAGIIDIIQHGYNTNAETLIEGAIVDLDAFETVVAEAADFQESQHSSHDRKFWLAIYNHDYDEQAEEHYAEGAWEDCHTAGEVTKAYVVACRQTGNWKRLAAHPRLNSLLWDWINEVSRAEMVSESELVALAAASCDAPQEGRFWKAIEKHFSLKLLSHLDERLSSGSEDRDVRTNAAAVAIKHAPDLLNKLLSADSNLKQVRMLELILDIQRNLENNEGAKRQPQAKLVKLLCNLDEQTSEIAKHLLNLTGAPPTSEVLDSLRSFPLTVCPELTFAIATTLANFGENISAHLYHLMSVEFDVTEENISLAEKAMELAAQNGTPDLFEFGLKHDFARCRIAAMNALAANSVAPLSKTLLDMRNDSSSTVRKHLLDLLEAKPHLAHTGALIDLTSDTWTPDHRYHEHTVDYPIAEKAARILLDQSHLPDGAYARIVSSLKKTENSSVKLLLLRAMVRFGSPSRQKKMIEIATNDGAPPHPFLAAQALVVEQEYVELSLLDSISDQVIATVRPRLACWLALLIANHPDDERIMTLAKSLAANKDRRVVLALLCIVVAEYQERNLAEPIGDLLSQQIREVLFEVLRSRDASDLGALDNLGDVRTVEAVKDLVRAFLE